jgi:hypothetical protein
VSGARNVIPQTRGGAPRNSTARGSYDDGASSQRRQDRSIDDRKIGRSRAASAEGSGTYRNSCRRKRGVALVGKCQRSDGIHWAAWRQVHNFALGSKGLYSEEQTLECPEFGRKYVGDSPLGMAHVNVN